MSSFEDLAVREKAGNLYDELLPIFDKPAFRHFYFKEQILDAALSISNNIAEGYERQSDREFVRYLYIARGSAGEVRNMLYRANKAKFIQETEFTFFRDESKKLSAMLRNLIKAVCKKNNRKINNLLPSSLE